jgi:hypothetical protein
MRMDAYFHLPFPYTFSIQVAVPKVLDVLRKGLLAKVKAAPSKAKRLLFDAALAARENSKNQGRASPLFDALIFKKVADKSEHNNFTLPIRIHNMFSADFSLSSLIFFN